MNLAESITKNFEASADSCEASFHALRAFLWSFFRPQTPTGWHYPPFRLGLRESSKSQGSDFRPSRASTPGAEIFESLDSDRNLNSISKEKKIASCPFTLGRLIILRVASLREERPEPLRRVRRGDWPCVIWRFHQVRPHPPPRPLTRSSAQVSGAPPAAWY